MALSRGSDVDAKDAIGRTALFRAAGGGRYQICVLLLEAKANPAAHSQVRGRASVKDQDVDPRSQSWHLWVTTSSYNRSSIDFQRQSHVRSTTTVEVRSSWLSLDITVCLRERDREGLGERKSKIEPEGERVCV
eukprot:733454-Rhodomonas_salina.3